MTVLDVYGSLFYAGSPHAAGPPARSGGAEQPVVVLRLRGRTTLGATFFAVVSDYADRLADVGGRLYLTGLEADLVDRLRRSERVPVTGAVRLFGATPVVGESTAAAYEEAQTFAVGRHDDA